MKKVVLALAVIATVACFSSCNKKCTCRTYVTGTVQKTEEIVLDKEQYKKCSDMTATVGEGQLKTGYECE